MKEQATSSVLADWLRERGVGYVFIPHEVKWEGIGCAHDAVSPALFTMYREGRVTREPTTGNNGRMTYRYTTTEKCLEPRTVRTRPVVQERKREEGYHKADATPVPPRSADAIVDDVMNLLAELHARCRAPLAQFTNLQLLAELQRRNEVIERAPPAQP